MGDEETSTFTMEIDGSNARQALSRLLNLVSLNDALIRARIELEFHGEVPIGNGLEADESVEEQVSEESEEPETSERTLYGVQQSNVPQLAEDGISEKALWALSEADNMVHTPEIRSIMNRRWDGEFKSLSKYLYNLEQQGLVDKKQSNQDGRMNKYGITSKGLAALELADGPD